MVFLKEEFGNRVYIPGPESHAGFDFPPDIGVSIRHLTVEGPQTLARQSAGSSNRVQSISSLVTTPLSSGLSAQGNSHLFSSATGFRSTSLKSKNYSLRIAKAAISYSSGGRVELQKYEQMFVDINEENANVLYISSAIQRKWGVNFVLCTSDAIPIEEGSGTHGRR